jgi:DNA mismatch repair protein MutS2
VLYPENLENRISFDVVRNLIKKKCLGTSAQRLVDEMNFSTDVELINCQLTETDEMMTICSLKDDFPSSSYPSIENVCSKLKIENFCLQLFELIDINSVLEVSKDLIYFFKKDEENKFPTLGKKLSKIIFPKYLYERLKQIISKTGTIKDSASNELLQIRRELISKNSTISTKINSILFKIREEGWVNTDLSATIINDRLLIPIETTYKRKIQGLVHAESASGKTTYIEPQEIVVINNDIRELTLKENREIQKILFELTEEFRPYQEELKSLAVFISEIDFIRAKALFSMEINAIKPAIDEKTGLDLVRAKHPILLLNLRKEKKEIIPISLQLDRNNRILIISGPNAGGKSVCLKTTALLCYMVQCGLLVPVGGSSVFGIFNDIFIDIGDQQSIENSLSTYSSHLQNMKYFLKNSNSKSLILIDEFGSGTDPQIGGILAQSILEELNNNETFGIITTHYSNLKMFAVSTPGLCNAAMLIDSQKMTPTFILEIGTPGSSYAIEIAQQIGLPQNIIEKTKVNSDNKQLSFDKLFRKVLSDKRYWERKRSQIRQQEKNLEEIYQKHFDELENLKSKKNVIIQETKKQSEQLLNDVNRQIENTIRKIKEAEADKNITKEARKEFDIFKNNFNSNLIAKTENLNLESEKIKKKLKKTQKIEFVENINKNEIHIGSKVRIIDQNTIGEVVDLGDKKAVISYGNIFTVIEILNLEKVSEEEYKKNKKTTIQKIDYNTKIEKFKSSIDLRGLTVEEALKEVMDFIDEAIMLNFKSLRILHGKGNGILRENVRNYLRTISQIEKIFDEDPQFGGNGITIVKLK